MREASTCPFFQSECVIAFILMCRPPMLCSEWPESVHSPFGPTCCGRNRENFRPQTFRPVFTNFKGASPRCGLVSSHCVLPTKSVVSSPFSPANDSLVYNDLAQLIAYGNRLTFCGRGRFHSPVTATNFPSTSKDDLICAG